MNKNLLISAIISVCSTVSAQNNEERVIIQTPRNEHSIARINGIVCVDDETEPFTGKYIKLGYENELKEESNFKNGKLDGMHIEYGKRDSVYIKLKVNYIKDKKVGPCIEYYNQYHKKLECFYNENGDLHGDWISYSGSFDDLDQPDVKGKYFNGKKDSTWIVYYEDGKPKSIKNYRLDKQQGVSTEYFENNHQKSECNYLNDKKEGLEQWWYQNGILKYSATYSNGKLHGAEYYYYEDGNLEKVGNYFNGIKKGKFIWYNTDGTIKEETAF